MSENYNYDVDITFEHIGDEHLIEHDEVIYSKPDNSFDVESYNIDVDLYEHELEEYNKLNWFRKLFTTKPIKPEPQDYV